MSQTNWSGNHRYPTAITTPASLAELSDLVRDATAGGRTVRVVGSRHSFNGIADAEVMVSVADLPERFDIDRERDQVWVSGAMTYGRLAELLRPEELALHNLASLPHISIAGAISTGTHGSGSRNANLATAVVELELMLDNGEIHRVSLADSPLHGVGLGATGIITAVALRTEPAFLVEQRVVEHLPWDAYLTNFDQIMDSAYSVSAFTDYVGADLEQVWLKRRTDEPDNSAMLLELGGSAATGPRHPLPGESAEACTTQLGEAGLWSDRLPHFRLDFTPSSGDEIQSEFFVDRRDGVAAIQALRSIGAELTDAMMVSEIRTIAADPFPMSPCFERDSVAFHFTWVMDQQVADQAAAAVAAALAPFAPRAHWGKVFPRKPQLVARLATREFAGQRPSARFVNDWLGDRLERVGLPAIGLGTFGSDHASHDAVADAVRHAISAGYRFIDCASIYGNESRIGLVLAEMLATGEVHRADLTVSSKVWNDQHDTVRASCVQTLTDLQLDYLDLYLVHWPFPNSHPPHCDIDERDPSAVPFDPSAYLNTWRQMEALVDEGLVRAIGTSNMTIAKLEPLLAKARIRPAVNQMETHPHFQQPELFEYLRVNGVQPIGFCPIGSPARPERDRTPDDTSPTEDPVVVEIANRHGVHPAVVCIKWAQQRGQIPIPFSLTPANIDANLGASKTDPLTESEMAAIASVDRNNRLIKGQVFLWPEATDWTDLWQ
jgi:diketogulonate reductase-like aldo/keto reductase